MSPPASSPLQAEAYALELATKLAEILQLQVTRFYSDYSVLVSAVATGNISTVPGHWMIRPILARIQANSSFQVNKVAHIDRSFNEKHIIKLD